MSITTTQQGRRNGFQSGEAMEHWKVLPAIMVGWQEKSLNSRHSKMAKAVTFWPWWQPFNSFCFQITSFVPLFPFFLFTTQKSGGGGWGTWLPSAPPLPPVSPALHNYCSYIQFNSGCCNSCIFIARAKILTRKEEKRTKTAVKQQQSHRRKQTKTNISKKTP